MPDKKPKHFFFNLREISEGEGDMGTWGASGPATPWSGRTVGLNEGSQLRAGVWGRGRGRSRWMAGRKRSERLRLGPGGWPCE